MSGGRVFCICCGGSVRGSAVVLSVLLPPSFPVVVFVGSSSVGPVCGLGSVIGSVNDPDVWTMLVRGRHGRPVVFVGPW